MISTSINIFNAFVAVDHINNHLAIFTPASDIKLYTSHNVSHHKKYVNNKM